VHQLGLAARTKLRASLTMLGLTMGVATLITVMTIVAGGKRLRRTKDRQSRHKRLSDRARTPFAVTDFNIIIKALKFKKIELEDMARRCRRPAPLARKLAPPPAEACTRDTATKRWPT